MKKLLLHILFLLTNLSTFAQFNNEKELAAKIKRFTSDSQLKKFLIAQDLIEDNKDTSTVFHVGKIKVDIFKKNLFGSPDDEIVLQLREADAYSVNFYYYKAGQFTKVPGHIERYFDNSLSYYAQSFTFSFENIYRENEYCVITNDYSEYVRTVSAEYGIFRITPDEILPVYSFEGSSSSYSGVLLYSYNSEKKLEFKLINNTYPKSLIIRTTFENEVANLRGDDNGDILSGSMSHGTKEEIIIFNDKSGKVLKTIENTEESFFLNSFEDIIKRKRSECDSNISFYITENFFSTYLTNGRKLPSMQRISSDSSSPKYVVCCNAYLEGRTLIIVSQNKNGNYNTSRYSLKPPVATILKPGIDSNRLYLFDKGYGKEEIVYFKKDTLISTEDRGGFRFNDTTFVYRFEDEETITFLNTEREYSIPLKKIEMYLKPEVLKSIKEHRRNKSLLISQTFTPYLIFLIIIVVKSSPLTIYNLLGNLG